MATAEDIVSAMESTTAAIKEKKAALRDEIRALRERVKAVSKELTVAYKGLDDESRPKRTRNPKGNGSQTDQASAAPTA